MRLALAQINTSMGAVDANCRRIARFLKEAASRGADLTVFPELALVGYPPKDLLEIEGFLPRSREALDRLAADHPKQDFIVGFVDAGGKTGKGKYNAAAYVSGGKVRFVQHKSLLPTYDIFEEARYFDSADRSDLVTIGGMPVGITICEDIWNYEEFLGRKLYERFPARELKEKGAKLIVNLSSSPYHDGKEKIRKRLFDRVVSDLRIPFVIVNLVGGNDEILFDGGSVALDPHGKVLARCKVFEEDLAVVDFGNGSGDLHPWPEKSPEWVARALTMGIRDYTHKCGFDRALIGLSGGIDSSLVALLAVEALGAGKVTGVSMPSPFTSEASQTDAAALAAKLGIGFLTLPIEPLMKEYDRSLADLFAGKEPDATEENIQARIRGNLLMALSNKFGALVLSTGNKSELAVGYCTQYGDMAGGLAVISDLPKEGVYTVARYLNDKWKAVPKRVFDRPPSAELRPDQKDEDSLPPYGQLDPILKMYVEERAGIDRIVKAGYPREVVERVISMVDRNEFKRRQAAPGLRLSPKAFGSGWRMPIARGDAS
ncbi:MAG: NAD+ synthase [Pseudomonadota bacterium]